MRYISTPRFAEDQPLFFLARSRSNVIQGALRWLVGLFPTAHSRCAQLGIFNVRRLLRARSRAFFGHGFVHGAVRFVGLAICHCFAQCFGALCGIHRGCLVRNWSRAYFLTKESAGRSTNKCKSAATAIDSDKKAGSATALLRPRDLIHIKTGM